ncbi:MAG: hypothetical protein HY703_04910 [Gemmatimonadetes bacterium]|nr:hypothetical protein [Gemmatimonadota bacterium]
MRTARRRIGPALLLAFSAAALPAAAHAQLINLKTVPVAAGDQFLVFPSRNLGMGGVSIALEDPLLDAFVNPAKGGRVQRSHFLGAPTFYNVSDDGAAGRTLPISALLASGDWFGGASLALQQLEAAGANTRFAVLEAAARDLTSNFFSTAPLLSERSSSNLYAFGMLGRKLGSRGLALAGSLFWAGLDAVDGVDLLYALSQDIEQSGHLLDYRLGLVAERERNSFFELLLLHHRFDMRHDVTYVNWICEPRDRCHLQTRVENNLDRTYTWGAHLGYVAPHSPGGWRVGGILTANWKTHPKIPNYEIMNIPRDPGNSWAYNFGVGASRSEGPATVALDLIYEPIWSDTWAEAAEAVKTRSGRIIPVGGKTVDNDFRFSNALFRGGISREMERFGFQLGLQIRSIRYWLDQYNHIEEVKREQQESWAEWTPSWGASLTFPEFDIRYVGRLTTGSGRPGVAFPWGGRRGAELASASDIILAPSGPLTLQEARVLTHQVSVSIPLRRVPAPK